MTKRHVIDFYMDGHVAVSFCKVCSAEGDKLFEECGGAYKSGLPYFKGMTREEFDEKFPDRSNIISSDDLEQIEGELEDRNRE